MSDHITRLHDDLEAFKTPNGLFDVEPTALDANIGRACRFIAPTCAAERDTFVVATTQYNYRGELCYRVVGSTDTHRFGRCASPSAIEFIEGGAR